ncbi:MAG: hypothetical protein R6U46_04530 [Marinilabilia sp.]
MSSRFFILLMMLSFVLFLGCEREYVYNGGGEGLQFSTDTVAFDTVFTSIGSSTHNLRIFNPVQDDIIVNAIELAGGDNSEFSLNVNGKAGSMIRDVPLRGNDSLFVFVEVDINPSSDNSPFVVSDSIIFYTDNHIQTVNLVAYGQNVVPLREEWLETQTFTNDKPYLIYDYMVVDSAQTLTIEPGARLHFHEDASLIVLGSLQVEGEVDNPVIFTSDRMEDWYKDKPGQWGFIHLMPESREHSFNHAVIRNSTMGIVADSVGLGDDPPVQINNVRIEHISSQGLIAQNSSIEASNSLFADCGSASVALTVGGTYKFYHCTIANYFDWAYRSTPALVISNFFTDSDGKKISQPLDAADFHNCIVYGRNENEVKFDFEVEDDEEVTDWINVHFSNSLVKMLPERMGSYSHAFDEDVIFNEDPSFVDVSEYDYRLDTVSIALDKGGMEVAREFPEDIEGNSRLEDKGPDMGAFERVDEQ